VARILLRNSAHGRTNSICTKKCSHQFLISVYMTDKSHLSLEATDQARTPPLFDPLYSPSSYSPMFNYYFEVFHQSIYFAERFLVKKKTSYNYVFESYYQISSLILCIPSRTQLSSNPNPLFCFLKSLNFLFTCSLLFPINREIIYKSVP
jgi:hypothetical protein